MVVTSWWGFLCYQVFVSMKAVRFCVNPKDPCRNIVCTSGKKGFPSTYLYSYMDPLGSGGTWLNNQDAIIPGSIATMPEPATQHPSLQPAEFLFSAAGGVSPASNLTFIKALVVMIILSALAMSGNQK